MRNLSAFDQKVSRGISNAEHHKRETASRASRISQQLEETLQSYNSKRESDHTRSLQSVIKKTSVIDSRRKKSNESFTKRSEHLKERTNLRFERNHSARSTVDDDNKRKNKMTLDRLKMKDRLRDIIIEKQQLELMKTKEINELKRADH